MVERNVLNKMKIETLKRNRVTPAALKKRVKKTKKKTTRNGGNKHFSRKNVHKHNKLVSALYVHKKHFSGWIYQQFVIKLILGPLFEPWRARSLIRIIPRILVNSYRYLRAKKEVEKLLNQ